MKMIFGILLLVGFICFLLILFFSTSPKIRIEEIEEDTEEKEPVPAETEEEKQERLNKLKAQIVNLPYASVGVNEETSYMLERFGLEEPEKNLHDDIE